MIMVVAGLHVSQVQYTTGCQHVDIVINVGLFLNWRWKHGSRTDGWNSSERFRTCAQTISLRVFCHPWSSRLLRDFSTTAMVDSSSRSLQQRPMLTRIQCKIFPLNNWNLSLQLSTQWCLVHVTTKMMLLSVELSYLCALKRFFLTLNINSSHRPNRRLWDTVYYRRSTTCCVL